MAHDLQHDTGLEYLLSLHGVIQVQSEEGHWVKYEASRVSISASRPHGIKYSLTLHALDGTRLMGFDNAHALGPRKSCADRDAPFDHQHAGQKAEHYAFTTAYQLLHDFFIEVDRVLKEEAK